jgi:hypothetical protein
MEDLEALKRREPDKNLRKSECTTGNVLDRLPIKPNTYYRLAVLVTLKY